MDRQAARRARRSAATQPGAQEIDIPLPLQGLYTEARRSRVSNMYAAELINWRSTSSALNLRPGIFWAGPVDNLRARIPFEFSATPRYIELTSTQVQCGSSTYSSRAFSANTMAATISENVVLADGGGAPIRYSESGFAPCAFTIAAGPSVATLDGVIAHHDRLIFWKTGGPLEFFSGDVGAVTGGALTRFPLGQLGNITGRMAGMLSLTMDAGHGMNDVLAIFTTTGQIIAYEGLDPADPNDWRLLGRVQAAAPIDKNAFAQVGSDVWMLTKLGVISVQQSLRSSTLALVSDISRPIMDTITDMLEEGADSWQIFTAGDGSMVVINRILAGAARQIIYYTQSQSWATADIPALQFHNLAGSPQVSRFSDGRIGTFKETDSQTPITATWVSSWFNVGRRVSVAFIRPRLRARGPLTLTVSVLSDGQDTAADIAESSQTVTLQPEENADEVTLYERIASDAVGQSFQIRLTVTAKWVDLFGMTAAIE